MCNNSDIQKLLNNNKTWVKNKLDSNPEFFDTLSTVHEPKYLWIGCSDARMPPNTMLGLDAGEIFVHRNVGNIVCPTDTNIEAVITYAVKYLKVQHIIVAGHYECGAVKASLSDDSFDAVDNWLVHIRDVIAKNRNNIDQHTGTEQANYVSTLNVRAQVEHLHTFKAVSDALSHNQPLSPWLGV
jgi:carbonic anhydrase